jgi:ribosomal-protein-alanine N-acetyltransferase
VLLNPPSPNRPTQQTTAKKSFASSGDMKVLAVAGSLCDVTVVSAVCACEYWAARDADHSDNRHMTEQLPSWPTTPPTYGSVVLREFTEEDAHLAVELGEDPYIPLIGSLPAHPTAQQALEWIHRQRGRLAEGVGLAFAIADAESDDAVGAIGLWLRNLSAGRATVGYSVSPANRGHGVATSALKALTRFAWTIPGLYRVELYIEPWNHSSIHVAEAAGYQREGLLRSHQEIGGTRRDMLLYATTRPQRGEARPFR